jgi:hypothetical protein
VMGDVPGAGAERSRLGLMMAGTTSDSEPEGG